MKNTCYVPTRNDVRRQSELVRRDWSAGERRHRQQLAGIRQLWLWMSLSLPLAERVTETTASR